jgi:hypothetical protein
MAYKSYSYNPITVYILQKAALYFHGLRLQRYITMLFSYICSHSFLNVSSGGRKARLGKVGGLLLFLKEDSG